MTGGTIKDVTRCLTVGPKGICVLLTAAVAALPAGSAWGALIDVELRTATPEVLIGETVEVEVWFVSDGLSPQDWVAADIWFKWDPAAILNYLGRVDNPELAFNFVQVFPDSLTNAIRWSAGADFFNAFTADPDPGTLVTTLQFEAKSASENVLISVFQPEPGPWTSITDGFDELLGTMGSTKITVTECNGNPCHPGCLEYDECVCFDPCEATLPVLVMPADVTISCTESTDPSNTRSASATDNCDPAPVVTYSDSVSDGTCQRNRLITRTWTATDSCGNSTSLDQAISVMGVAGDVDGDCDADLDDYAVFASVLAGPGVLVECFAFDTDGDGDIDLRDFAAFQQAVAGN